MPSQTSSMEPQSGSVYDGHAIVDGALQPTSNTSNNTIHIEYSAGRTPHAPGTRRRHRHSHRLEQHADQNHRSHRHSAHTHRNQPNQSRQIQPLQPLPRHHVEQDYYFRHFPAGPPVGHADQFVIDEEPVEQPTAAQTATNPTVNGAYAGAPTFTPEQTAQGGATEDRTMGTTTLLWYTGYTPEQRQAAYEGAAALYRYVDRNL